MLDIYHNHVAFKNLKPLNFTYFIVLLTIMISLIILMLFKTKVYDHYASKSYVTCEDTCTLDILYPSNINYDYIQFNNKNLTFNIIGEEIIIDEENFQSFKKQSLTFTNNVFKNQEIINVDFYYHKQRLLNKLLKLLF